MYEVDLHRKVVLIGEIGGEEEEKAADFFKRNDQTGCGVYCRIDRTTGKRMGMQRDY
jgi:succinyl-CoA synthetase alpha subunit